MKIGTELAIAAVGLLALACSGDESTDSNPLASEPGRLEPSVNPDSGESPSSAGSMPVAMPAGTSSGDCAGTIGGAGPVVAFGGTPVQPPAAEVGSTMADAYRFRVEFGYLQVTVRSDVGGSARVFQQGVPGNGALVWNVQAGQASTETLGLPRGGYAISFEPFGTTSGSVDVSLEASAYAPVECEPTTPAPEEIGLLSPQQTVRGGYVGNLDLRDGYRFQLLEAATLSMSVTEVRGDVALQLFPDTDRDEDNPIVLLIASSNNSRSIPLPRGTYQLEVGNSILPEPNNLYTLNASATEYPVHDHPQDDGAATQDAHQLGTLGEAGLTVGGYLGRLDPLDAYRIQLAEPAAVVLRLADASGSPVVRLFQDAVAVDDDDALLSVFNDARTTEVLSPGTYLIRVTPGLIGAHAFYTLEMGLAR